MSSGISVVIPTYDRPRRLARALQSCFSQNVSAHEVIVVDNGQNEDTARVVDSAQRLSGPVPLRYLKSKPMDLRAALALGIGEASGEWTILLDDDDFLVPDRFKADCASRRHLNSETILVIHDFIRVDYRSLTVWHHRMPDKQLGLREALSMDSFPPPPAGTWSTKALKTFHPFGIPDGWTDFDLYATMLQHGSLSVSGTVGYVMDDTRVPGRLTTNPAQTMHMLELHRERYREIRSQVDASDHALGRRLNQQQAFFAGKSSGASALFGPSRSYCLRYPVEFLKGTIAPYRSWISRFVPDLLPEMRGSKTYSMKRFESDFSDLAIYIREQTLKS